MKPARRIRCRCWWCRARRAVSRWIQADAFGAPLARLLATQSGWRRDGFVPPNHAAQAVFTAMFPLLENGFSDGRPRALEGGGAKWRLTPLGESDE